MAVLLTFVHSVYAQDAILPLGSPAYAIIERAQILGAVTDSLHSSIKPWRRSDVFGAAWRSAASGNHSISLSDLRYLFSDNDEYFLFEKHDTVSEILSSDSTSILQGPPQSRTPALGLFYTRPAHFYAYDSRDFYLRVNPILHFGIGHEDSREGALFVNRRGIELRGGIDQKVFFYTNIIEAQLRPASYINAFVDRYHALPDAGLYKDFDSRVFKGAGAYDYLTSSGYVGFGLTRHIGVQLGHGKNFIGDGYRSLFLSDFAKNYFYLKFNTRIWRFHYQNIFAELGAREKLPGNVVVPKKFLAAHYLSFRVSPRLRFGLFEGVIFARENNQFELQYLNPIILYRSIEPKP